MYKQVMLLLIGYEMGVPTLDIPRKKIVFEYLVDIPIAKKIIKENHPRLTCYYSWRKFQGDVVTSLENHG